MKSHAPNKRCTFKGLVAALALVPVMALAAGPWRILNADWSSYLPKGFYADAGGCFDAAVNAWHAYWPGHQDAVFTLVEATPTSYAWSISNNASGGLHCVRSENDAGNNDEALRQSILNTCVSLSGAKKARCVAAANESYRQCMSER
ncbi:MAG: hypothetical protein QM569_01165 [Acidovorax sp.]|uniref:hypothetical protein n=1 Tax=Acidovorax sp. TaxID=1872122 RepID=UPI0039E440B8